MFSKSLVCKAVLCFFATKQKAMLNWQSDRGSRYYIYFKNLDLQWATIIYNIRYHWGRKRYAIYVGKFKSNIFSLVDSESITLSFRYDWKVTNLRFQSRRNCKVTGKQQLFPVIMIQWLLRSIRHLVLNRSVMNHLHLS